MNVQADGRWPMHLRLYNALGGSSIRDYCWGANDHGQLGDGTFRDRWRRAAVPGLAGVTAIAAGGAQTCALLSDQRKQCWGIDPAELSGENATSETDPRGLGAHDRLFR